MEKCRPCTVADLLMKNNWLMTRFVRHIPYWSTVMEAQQAQQTHCVNDIEQSTSRAKAIA